jgi:hypothetical protein
VSVEDRFEMPLGGPSCHCPKCHADLRAGEIPARSYHLYGYGDGESVVTCRDGCGAPPHFSNLTGIYDIEQDMTRAWFCPECQETWPRG